MIMRPLILAVLFVGLCGMGAELLLLQHTGSVWELIPLVLIGLSLAMRRNSAGSNVIWSSTEKKRSRSPVGEIRSAASCRRRSEDLRSTNAILPEEVGGTRAA
jgi:hypothetical protein